MEVSLKQTRLGSDDVTITNWIYAVLMQIPRNPIPLRQIPESEILQIGKALKHFTKISFVHLFPIDRVAFFFLVRCFHQSARRLYGRLSRSSGAVFPSRKSIKVGWANARMQLFRRRILADISANQESTRLWLRVWVFVVFLLMCVLLRKTTNEPDSTESAR